MAAMIAAYDPERPERAVRQGFDAIAPIVLGLLGAIVGFRLTRTRIRKRRRWRQAAAPS